MVKDNVRQALTHYDICHRGAEFEELFARATAKINKLFKADDTYRSMIISGSGTSSNDRSVLHLQRRRTGSADQKRRIWRKTAGDHRKAQHSARRLRIPMG